ncbi:glycoside hydrolase family 97 protein [Draconibacterium mangrovi]|uniref:glycoside hydrolase family 97 protein n=1 Tax=Draconibacterium mangrovi TaxID=2697469 RepID=UPI0013D0A153|nr:glycoside hydrolase family 97 protein [Draconibacterium mangrovi]
MKNLSLIFLALVLFGCNHSNSVVLQSPDRKLKISVTANDTAFVVYSVESEGTPLIQKSKLGFAFENAPTLGRNMEIVSSSELHVNQSWKPVYGERAEIPDTYHQAIIHLKETVEPEREMELTVRAYNEGIAFQYTLLPTGNTESVTIQQELTEFCFSKDYNGWVSDRAQSEYRKVPISEITSPAERPLVVEADEKLVAIGEAKLVDFSRMKLQAGERANSLVATLHDNPSVKLPYTSPWRTIMTGDSPGELLEHNYFLQNLNDPCTIEDVSWIKPGKVIREVTLTTRGGMACVDFAAENGLQYVEFDAGWYGFEYDDSSDASTITVDPKRSPGPLELQKVINYANTKGIGIILYVNRRALEKQLDEILPLYKSWGVKGVKYGFVQVGSQEWTTWLHEAVKKAADNQLMVDIHDEYRPTGFSRTYPNLMTQEGIRGDEESPDNQHTLTTLFTRMLAGAADNTICYFAPRVTEKMGGHVSQLAKAVMMYSPWQFLFWYDRPPNSSEVIGGVPGAKDYIEITPELEFFKNMPTVWDETRVLEGEIGAYATLARKSGNDWYLGSLTGNVTHTAQLDLSFLEPGKNYETLIYSHDPDAEVATKVRIDHQEMRYDSILSFDIGANSGLAIHFKQTN